VDPSQTVTFFVQQWNSATGTFTNASLTASGFTSLGNGLYQYSGLPSAATTAARALVFAPAQNRVAPGFTETSSFSLAAYDAAGQSTSAVASVVSTSMNEAPTVASLSSSFAAVRTGQTFTLTAGSVADIDGTVQSVRFWRDSDNDGVLSGGDELLGSDTDSTDGWSFNATMASAWGTGAQRFLATPIDNDAAVGSSASVQVTASANTGALVAALASSRSSATFGQSLTLTASGVTASSGTIKSVSFYYDTNGNGVWDNTDKKLSTDSNSSGGWTANVSVANTWTVGQHLFFARATDNAGLGSSAAFTFTLAPNTAPAAGTLVASSSTLPSNNNVALSLSGWADTDGSITSVSYYVDTNGNGVLDAADRRLSSSSTSSNGFRITTSLQRSWARNGSILIFARATDNLGAQSSVVSTLIAA
jgi:hypothetical protein